MVVPWGCASLKLSISLFCPSLTCVLLPSSATIASLLPRVCRRQAYAYPRFLLFYRARSSASARSTRSAPNLAERPPSAFSCLQFRRVPIADTMKSVGGRAPLEQPDIQGEFTQVPALSARATAISLSCAPIALVKFDTYRPTSTHLGPLHSPSSGALCATPSKTHQG